MEKILIVSSAKKSKELLVEIIKSSGNYEIESVDDKISCQEIIKNKDFDLIIINAPLKDDYGEKLAIFIDENTSSDIILIIKNDYKEKFSKLEGKGIFILEKPINKFLLMNIINLYIIHRRRYNLISKENEQLKKTISNIKLINRAKLTLIQYLKMSEDEAHRYIEKQAMDLRITKVEIAKNILKITCMVSHDVI